MFAKTANGSAKCLESYGLVSIGATVPPSNELWSEVDKWLAAGNSFSDTALAYDAQLAAERVHRDKAELAQKALVELNEAVTILTGNVPKVESDSWPKQEIEARDLTKQTLLIDQLIIDRGLGETREQLATKIIVNADAYAPAYAKALGTYQARLKALI